jgi:hypothetical protein
MGLPGCSSWFPGAEVDGAWDALGDATALLGFIGLLSLPMWVSMWTGSPTLCTVLRSVTIRRGDRASCQVLPYLVAL